jgi:hypothetical protein
LVNRELLENAVKALSFLQLILKLGIVSELKKQLGLISAL